MAVKIKSDMAMLGGRTCHVHASRDSLGQQLQGAHKPRKESGSRLGKSLVDIFWLGVLPSLPGPPAVHQKGSSGLGGKVCLACQLRLRSAESGKKTYFLTVHYRPLPILLTDPFITPIRICGFQGNSVKNGQFETRGEKRLGGAVRG